MKTTMKSFILAITALVAFSNFHLAVAAKTTPYWDTVAGNIAHHPTHHKTIDIDGVEIFYREAGSKDAPTLVLLHGYPTSSHMFRNLIRDLSNDFHLIAPDYPGYGKSE